jgi:type II secretory pathway component PulJ
MRGFTVLELLVAMSLGLVVVHVALSAWQTSQQSWLALVAQQNLQHNARAALEAMAQQAALTGANVLVGAGNSPAVALASSQSARPADLGTTLPAVFAMDNAHGGDSLRLGHWRDADASDCQGNRHGTDAWVQSQFQRSTSTPHDFACKDVRAPSSTYQALAEGVEDFQVRLAEVSGDGQRLRWQTPSAVIDWHQVVAIEVCLRVASPTLHAVAQTSTRGCSGEALPADGHLRRVVRRVMRVQQRDAFHG